MSRRVIGMVAGLVLLLGACGRDKTEPAGATTGGGSAGGGSVGGSGGGKASRCHF